MIPEKAVVQLRNAGFVAREVKSRDVSQIAIIGSKQPIVDSSNMAKYESDFIVYKRENYWVCGVGMGMDTLVIGLTNLLEDAVQTIQDFYYLRDNYNSEKKLLERSLFRLVHMGLVPTILSTSNIKIIQSRIVSEEWWSLQDYAIKALRDRNRVEIFTLTFANEQWSVTKDNAVSAQLENADLIEILEWIIHTKNINN